MEEMEEKEEKLLCERWSDPGSLRSTPRTLRTFRPPALELQPCPRGSSSGSGPPEKSLAGGGPSLTD